MYAISRLFLALNYGFHHPFAHLIGYAFESKAIEEACVAEII